METFYFFICYFTLFSSYRTYEEWKRSFGIRLQKRDESSYRTYEEWKLQSKLYKYVDFFEGSYRTYEEWKHASTWPVNMPVLVLTVPMRNGNVTAPSHTCGLVIVLTVPMRNGN